MSLGRISEFNEDMSWSTWIERLTFYCEGNLITAPEKKRAVLLTMCGESTYETLKALLAPQLPSEVSISSTASTPATDRASGDSPPQQQATTEQPTPPTALPLDVMMRDRFICGIRDKNLQQRLLVERDVTFDRAFKIALATESAVSQQGQLQSAQERDQVNIVRRKSAGHRKKTTKTQRCGRCLGDHEAKDCRFKNAICNRCNKKGHIARACKQQHGAPVAGDSHHLASGSDDERSSSSSELYQLNHVGDKLGHPDIPKFTVTLKVEGKRLNFEVDSGAACSIISEQTYRERWLHNPPELKKKTTCLRTWSGEGLRALGTTQVRVRFKTKDFILTLTVMRGTGCNLLGRDWFRPLNIRVSGIHHVQDSSQLHTLLKKYETVFVENIDGHKGGPVSLELKENAAPCFLKARPVPFALRSTVEKEIDQLVSQGVLEPAQHSDWATPLTVNLRTKASSYPLPTTTEVFTRLRGGKIFSTLDLKQAYQQLRLTTAAAEILTVNTIKGLFRVKRLPFGISAAPGIFQRFIDTLLADIPGTSAYLDDDVIVCGKDIDEHNRRLEQVLRHRIDAEGLHPTDDKVKALLQAPSPKSKTELKAFLGMLSFYDRFLRNRAAIARDLYELLKHGNKSQWLKRHQSAFENLKKLINECTVLAHYDETNPLVIACDASPYGVGAVLAQVDDDVRKLPVAFASRTLGRAEQNYAQLDREGLALVFAVEKFHQYVAGRSFKIYTDHRPLLGIMGQHKPMPGMLSSRMTRWCLKLGCYDYDFCYRKGTTNQNADAFSRLPLPSMTDEPYRPGDVVLLDTLEGPVLTANTLEKMTQQDPMLSAVHRALRNGSLHKLRGQGFDQYKIRRRELATEGDCAGRGIVTMKACARSYMWWPGIDRDIEQLVRGCSKCQVDRRSPPRAPPPLWTRPTEPWKTIHIDFAGPVDGRTYLLVVDAYTKLLEVMRMTSTTAAAVIEQLETKRFFKANGVEHRTSAPYHPATNGQVKRMVAELKRVLKRDSAGHVDKCLARFMFKQHTTINATTGKSPAAMMFSRELPSPLSALKPSDHRSSMGEDEEEAGSRYALFKPSMRVYIRNFTGGRQWIPGQLLDRMGWRL
ncbi:uncharacterized protein K02A2.6-like [Ornithodoros turicata]|uniref:uncharacterized protein K02A2.6-like n=1 Tax=Ornithodoros turicata TaxID=34597 RepID=UPI003138F074